MEAKKIDLDYRTIRDIAKSFAIDTNISNVFDFKQVLMPFGAKINYIPAVELEGHYFVDIRGKNDLVINLPQDVSDEFERFLLAQALGHYVLHAKNGEIKCEVGSITKSESSQEAVWFALELLLPDDDYVSKNLGALEDQVVSRLYRVPEFLISVKKTMIENFYNRSIV